MEARVRVMKSTNGTPYQFSRSANCVRRAAAPEFCVERMPFPATPVGLFGWLNTLKKSALKRSVTRSLRCVDLMSDASWNHCSGPGRYWFRHGCRPVSYVVRCTVPLFNGIQTVFVSQNCETTVPAGALAGIAVE